MRTRQQSDLERRLRSLRAPDEPAAQRRAWRTVSSAFEQLPAEPAPVRIRKWRLAVAPSAAVIAGVLALTPAGAAVHKWIEQTLGVRHASPALFSLPGAGQILVSGPGGAWIVSQDGSRHRLGGWRQASWSPHGLYVAVASRTELAAVNPHGMVAWALARPAVSDPRWFSPNGYRIAYISAGTLRVIPGNGVGDRELSAAIDPRVAPAWRQGYAYQLAYVTATGGVKLQDTGTGRILWYQPELSSPRQLAWSADGSRLLVRFAHGVLVLDSAGRLLAHISSAGAPASDAAISPDGRTVAMLSGPDLTLTTLPPTGGGAPLTRHVFAGQGLRELAFSPDGQWLLVSWPAADQWVFVRATGRPRILAVSRIAEQFSSGSGRQAFPALDGWCCTAAGGAP